MSWRSIVAAAALAEALLIAAAMLYMVIYGVLNPGHPEAFYQQHARVASPWVSLAAGIPIFFALGRWLTKREKGSAVSLWAAWAVIDTIILIAAAGFSGIYQILPFWVASHATKFTSAWLGSKSGERTRKHTIETGPASQS